MARKCTEQEERFAVEVVTGVDQDGKSISLQEAYKRVYKGNVTDKTCYEMASRVRARPHVDARVNELRANIAQKKQVTVESLLDELEEARQAALAAETPQASAAVTATMGKAKLCGLDKQIIDHNIKIVDDGSHEW
jgi:phage terminase small subunit